MPVLTTDEGAVFAEAHLILRYLDEIAEPRVFPADDLARTLEIAAPALGAIEASTAIMIGRKSSVDFDGDMVGKKRFRTIASGLAFLDANLPRHFEERADIANIAAVTLIDYVILRFPERGFLSDLPALNAWRERQAGHPAVEKTMPFA